MKIPYVKHLRNRQTLLPLITAASLLPCGRALAWESYHDPNLDDEGYCSTCHPGFKGGRSDTLHALHTGGTDPVTFNCNLCHTGSGRDNPLTMWSIQDGGTGLGCMGCHGHDYGETITADYRGLGTLGRPKNSGYGLRRHHARAGRTICATCHTNDVNVVPYGEEMINPGLGNTVHYYLRADVSLGGQPVNPCANEDSANDADTKGLDNDGDFVYDASDPDCNGARPLLAVNFTAPNTALLSWPVTNGGWRLQENALLGSTNWQDVAVVPRDFRTNDFWQVILSPVATPRFYRLIKPQ